MPRLPDCRIVGKELTFVFPSNGDAIVGYRMIRDAVDAAENAVAPPPCPTLHDCRAGQTERCTCCDGEG